MTDTVTRIVVGGGGTAGWLSAAFLAAWAKRTGRDDLSVTLVESPDIPNIGVGEGTWPTMRETLATIGIEEADFLRSCDASFKQGSRFDGWRTGGIDDRYYHPFTPPTVANAHDLVAVWQAANRSRPFAGATSPQPAVCDADLAPRQESMPSYAGALNYGYHLDAGKLVELLRRHAVSRLGVFHVQGRIQSVIADESNGIAAVEVDSAGRVDGDLFLDCSGLKGLLIGGHFQSAWKDQSSVLANDRALAAQVPVDPKSSIASQTIGTAHEAGWLWDIGLPTRRGIGCVYSSRFVEDDRARAILDDYIRARIPGDREYSVRKIEFPTGHREQFWVGNCVAIGLSAGFIEPLEASAIVLVELSLRALTESFPSSRARMPFLAERFNAQFTLRWERIVEFLKLHYVLSERDEPYWRAQRDPATVPPRLNEMLALWLDQPPSAADLPFVDEMFPPASYQYVYYGMGGALPSRLPQASAEMIAKLARATERTRALCSALPTNRAYLDALRSGSRQESAA
ncbi:tryptophan 7-halogenase [Sphingomonas flavescens]|uniref:tryptophan halogenase family protein n=1 Tax=Sphingomonas flavescens TaxID=3132797 RepID=UPI002806136A|nr:tryptophan 7-halogenase [Sphingomonas limnosediminicola]